MSPVPGARPRAVAAAGSTFTNTGKRYGTMLMEKPDA